MIRQIRFFSLFLLFITCTVASFASAGTKDTIKVKRDSLNVRYFYESTFDSPEPFHYLKNDTSLKGLQYYDPRYAQFPFVETSSNTGQAYKNLMFSVNSSPGFDYGKHSFDGYTYQYDRVKYYKLNAPFTKLFFTMGAKREQIFNIVHSQNIRRNWNAGVDFNLIYSNGTFKRQKSDEQNLVLFTSLSSKNQRYHLFSNFIHNRLKEQENGGIENDSIFENGQIKAGEIGISLYGAENHQRESSAYIKQYYSLGTHHTKTIDTTKTREFVSFGKIAFSSLFKRQIFVYNDAFPTDGFYANVFYDTLQTQDSTVVYRFENTLEYLPYEINLEKSSFGIRINAGVKQQYVQLRTDSIDRYFNQFIPQAGILIFAGKHLQLHIKGNYVVGDYNDKDYNYQGSIQYRMGPDSICKIIELSGGYIAKEPEWMTTHYCSNNFIWDNHFKKITGQYAGIDFHQTKLSIGINYYLLNNFVYYDINARPNQSSQSSELISAFLFKDFIIGNWAFDNHIVYQKTFGANVIRLPELMSKHSLYFNHAFFKKALISQIGVDLAFNNKYYADEYMPATSQFYIQNKKQIGNYPYIDLFLNAKIKRANIFVKLQHATEGLLDKTYYSTPHYPLQGRAIKFGVCWKFYD